MYQCAYYVHHSKQSHLSLHSVIIVYDELANISTLGGNKEAGVVCTQVSTDHVQQSWKQHSQDKNNEEGNDRKHFTFYPRSQNNTHQIRKITYKINFKNLALSPSSWEINFSSCLFTMVWKAVVVVHTYLYQYMLITLVVDLPLHAQSHILCILLLIVNFIFFVKCFWTWYNFMMDMQAGKWLKGKGVTMYICE